MKFLNPVILQNNLNFFVNLLNYVKISRFNHEIIEARHQLKGEQFSNLNVYRKVLLDQAWKLCDMIFTNN